MNNSADNSINDRDVLQRRIMARLRDRIDYAEIDTNQRIVYASPGLQPLSDDPQRSLIGLKLDEAFAELVGLEKTLLQVQSGELPHLQLPAVNRTTPEDVMRYFDFSLYPLDRQKPDQGLLLLVEEDTMSGRLHQELVQERNLLRLTQAELAEANIRLQRLDQIKTLFLSMAAHDLRNPLSVIRGYTDLILEELTDVVPAANPDVDVETWQRYLQIMQDQSVWLGRLVANVLDLNLIEQGLLVVKPEPFDLRQTLTEIEESLQFLLAYQDKMLICDVPNEPVIVQGEPDRLRQIVQNLVGNSVKFIGESGQITLTLRRDDTTRQAVLRVQDTGPGIPLEFQKHLFKLYYRAPGVDSVQGTGLGLYIVKTLVDQHKGTITVESQPGEGTSFIVSLPLDGQFAGQV